MVGVGEGSFHRRCDGGPSPTLSAKIMVWTVSLSLALGATESRAAQAGPAGAIVQGTSNSGQIIRDLGLLPPPPDSDNPTPTSGSASMVSSVEPVPELPTWAMMLLCLAGLGLAGFKKGRKNRLSPGID
jgi:hypothetical protein